MGFIYNPGTSGGGGVTDHGALTGLADDDHTQYVPISSGAGVPGSTPVRIGALYVDTTNANIYIAKGTTNSSDWFTDNVDTSGFALISGSQTVGQSGGDWVFENGVQIDGDLTVKGGTTVIESNIVNVGDNLIVLNYDETGSPTQDAGIEIERGTSTNAQVLWNETTDRWQAGIVGSLSNITLATDLGTMAAETATDYLAKAGNLSGLADVSTARSNLGLAAVASTGSYGDLSGTPTIPANIDELSDVVITTVADNEVLAYDTSTSKWINQTASEAGLAVASHTHSASDITSGTFDDARIAQSNVTQHEAAIDHNALTNYSANRHIDWTAASSNFSTTGTISGTSGAIDFNGAASLKIPQSAAPTISANGHIGVDTTVADFSHGILKYYGGEECGVVSMPIAQFTSPTDGHVVTYDATNDEFKLAAGAGGGSGWVKISSATASASSSISFTSGIDGTYKKYMLVITGYRPSSDARHLLMEISSDGGSTWLSSALYDWGHRYWYNTTTNTASVVDQTLFRLVSSMGNATDESMSIILYFDEPDNASLQPKFHYSGVYISDDNVFRRVDGAGSYTSAVAFDGLKFTSSFSTIAEGDFTLYGLTP